MHTEAHPVNSRSLRIIGVGNRFRSDDGAGPTVLDRLKSMGEGGSHLVEATGEGAALMHAWEGAHRVILIDAARSGGPPGEIVRFDVHREGLPSRYFHYSTHAFSVAEAIELARALGVLPRSMVVYGIEGRRFEAGTALSPEVSRAAEIVADRIRDEIMEVHRDAPTT